MSKIERATRMARFVDEIESVFEKYKARVSLYWEDEEDPGTVVINFEGSKDSIEIRNPAFCGDVRFNCPEDES